MHLEDLLCKLDLGLAGQKIRHGRGIDTAIYGYIYADALATIPRRISEEMGMLADHTSLGGL